ncbi:MAG: hypothetical protein R3C68_08825 [Myxococcota bacterium]
MVDSYEVLQKTTKDTDFLIPAGCIATAAMARLGRIPDAEKLARSLLSQLKNKKHGEREGELYRLLARIYAQSGRLDDAVKEAKLAAKSFEATGDLYHAATAYGFIGDLYRETGDFELAKQAFVRFQKLAEAWGDRDLIQIAELADAWVSLDIGELTQAAQQIATVEKEMSAAPSRRLKRYLAAARALLEAGRGGHREAATALARVVEVWDAAGQRAIADVIRAQLVRSLIACGELDEAERIVTTALARLDPKTASPRVAAFLRESALIRLRRKDVKKAMQELGEARKLFAEGGNRREEALVVYRIAHAALEIGDVELAATNAKEVLSLAQKIKHTRAIGLARELQGRVALMRDKPTEAIAALKEAQAALRKLGDEVGTLHVSESLLRGQILAGDLASAVRLGPKICEQAGNLGINDVRLRTSILTAVALLRRSKLDAASRYFTELPDSLDLHLPKAMMWRLGEALAAVQGDRKTALKRRAKWAQSIRQIPESRRDHAVRSLEQLGLPPRERCELRLRGSTEVVGSELLSTMDVADFDLFVDVQDARVFAQGDSVNFDSLEARRLLMRLVIDAPAQTTFALAYQAAFKAHAPDNPTAKLKPVLRDLTKALKQAKDAKITETKSGLKLSLPRKYALAVPTYLSRAELTKQDRQIMRLMAQFGSTSLQAIQDKFELPRPAARREVAKLVDAGLVETIRDGRGRAFRLA